MGWFLPRGVYPAASIRQTQAWTERLTPDNDGTASYGSTCAGACSKCRSKVFGPHVDSDQHHSCRKCRDGTDRSFKWILKDFQVFRDMQQISRPQDIVWPNRVGIGCPQQADWDVVLRGNIYPGIT